MNPLHRSHRMPFGSQLEPGGGVHFRLWAPSARQVSLCLEAAELPMPAIGQGWFAVDVPEAGAGSRYRFRIDGGRLVPDPASRFNPEDVHGPSEVIDPAAFAWADGDWRGRPWEEAVIYELHVGSFTAEGSFAAVAGRLDDLAELGVTAIELMPVADFPGRRNWGYDGVLPFAPDSSYGRPHDLKRLIQAAHARGLMVLLDVVYNHFGPEGNYLHTYAEPFFNAARRTPWGPAINFEGPDSEPVRSFFIHNALYWLEEYHFDGLRIDAVHAIDDASTPDIVEALAAAVRQGPGRQRQIHLILENDRNQARYLGRDAEGAPCCATAQWNDDFHHPLHRLLTGEAEGYYGDYAALFGAPARHLARALGEGFAFQGEFSPYRGHVPRGEPSDHLPPTAFVGFLQNHDQVGNRAFGERLGQLVPPEALAAATAILLLAPAPPLLFMGEEFAAAQPFLYFCDFEPQLAAAVRAGRRRELARFLAVTAADGPAQPSELPDPNAESTFAACVLDWASRLAPPHERWLVFYRSLLAIRRQQIVPRLRGMKSGQAAWDTLGEAALEVAWRLGDGSRLTLLANLGAEPVGPVAPPPGVAIHRSDSLTAEDLAAGRLPPWSVAWVLDAAARSGRAGP
ncbi:malto-oligosyltrehalose trehalohydrolase [Dechloromonas sp. A34]|uniref:malto-oligosyltrehalose trehalohydrolase n=1 Tax=Dechloromonas sp. A34 TaxID=447588 RepID=UPI00224939DB|nr:malto-oligosyltrehalose trehalohydrolase [Dechloromonas sp. A34]